MIPNADEWTIVFSKNSTSWGSFTYDEKEDALRVTGKPKTADMHNALTYDFDNLQGEKRSDEAFVIFRENAKKHPDQWYVHSGMARIYCSQKKFDDAAKEMKLALAGAPDDQKSYVDGLVKKLESKQDINQ